jgi:branched-chain amino acid transport system substrate-binding protein
MKAKWIARWGMTLVVLAAMWVMMGYGVGNVEGAQSTITVGRIIPVTGPLAGFGEGIPWIDEYKVNSVNKDGGLLIGNERYKIEYKIYDSKSTVAGSGEAATKAILKDKVDVLMALGAPDTTAAPADLAERHKIPCITTVAPVEAMLYGPDRKPKVFKYTFHFFLSVRDLVGNHLGLLKTVNNFNGKIGYLFPNDVDGMVFYQTFDPILKKEGYAPVDTGRFNQGLPDFSAVINKFKRERVEVVLGVTTAPDLQNFLQQAAQSGFKPKMVIVDKATIDFHSVAAIGRPANGILGIHTFSPAWPGRSKYSGHDAATLIKKYEDSNPGRYHNNSLAYSDAAYDILFDALQRAGSADRQALVEGLGETDLGTVVGRIKFNEQNMGVTPVGTVQWWIDPKSKLAIKRNVYNAVYPEIKKDGEMTKYGEPFPGK